MLLISQEADKNTPSFTTKVNKFKVVINASASNPQYAVMSYFAYPEGESTSYVGDGDMGTFSQSSQSDEFEVTASPGTYYLERNCSKHKQMAYRSI